MRKLLFILIIPLISSCEKSDGYPPENKNTFNLYSEERNEEYTIWIYLPEGYFDDESTFNTIYLLDAQWDREYVARTSGRISREMNAANAVIVGIGYGSDRMDDYSPTVTKDGRGRANEFMGFIEKELIPVIEATYRVRTDRDSRCILGHSMGGLCAAYAFTRHAGLFGHYIILSPSLWWDDDIVLQYEQQHRNELASFHNTVYLGVGGTEGPMIAHSKYFHQMLLQHYPETVSGFALIKGKGHMSSKEDNIEKGLKFYFNNR